MVKFYLKKQKNQKYYVIISEYNTEKKSNEVKYKSLKTNLKQEALIKFNEFIKNHANPENLTINKNISIEDFYKEILETLKSNLNKNTIKIYDLSVRKFIEIVKNKMLRLINTNDLELFKTERLKQKVSKFEVNKEMSTLKALFNLAIKLNYLNVNPCKYVKKFNIENNKIKVFSEMELELLINNIKNPLLNNIVKFAILTGLRLNEILNVKLSDIDWNNNVINIYQTKTKKFKICILTNKLKELLNNIIPTSTSTSNIINFNNTDTFIFTVQGRNSAISKDYISHCFKKECRKLNLKGV